MCGEGDITMYEISMNINKELDISSIKHLLVKGESLADNIKIKVPRTYEGMDLKDKIFTIKTQNSSGVYYEKVLTKTVEDSTITLSWVVTRAFTGSPGSLKITLHISDSSGYSLATKAAEVNVAHSVFIATPIAPTDVLEDYLQEIRVHSESASNSAEQSLKILTDMNSKIVDGFTSTAKDKALSANKGRELNTRIDNIVSQTGTSNTEIVDARNSPERGIVYPTLKARLDSVDGDIVKSKYSAPTTATAPIITLPSTAVKGKMEGSLKGNTLYNAVTNGDFRDGTTGWSAISATLNVTNNILVVTGNGASVSVRCVKSSILKSNTKHFLKLRARVTNESCTTLRLGTELSSIITINNPIKDKWYDMFALFTSSTDTDLRPQHIYQSTAIAKDKMMEIDGNVGVFAIPISGTIFENWTAEELNAVPIGYWEGLGSSKASRVKVGETELFCPVELGSVPSGVADEFTFDGIYTQRTKETNVDLTAIADQSNVALAFTGAFLDNSPFVRPINPNIVIGGKEQIAYISSQQVDDIANIGKYYTMDNQRLYFIFAKGTTLEQAKLALANTKVRYQIATPIEIKYPTSNLISEPSGTILIDSAIKVVKPYTTNIVLDVKIKNLTSVTKVDGETRVPVLPSLVNISTDGMSLTILNSSSGDMYELEYETFGATLPTMEYSYPLNLNAQVQGNTDGLKATDKKLQDFFAYQNAVNAQVDLRLVLLERK